MKPIISWWYLQEEIQQIHKIKQSKLRNAITSSNFNTKQASLLMDEQTKTN